MSDYRVYVLDREGHIQDLVIMELQTDEEALTAAEELRRRRRILALEVWLRSRLIGSLRDADTEAQ